MPLCCVAGNDSKTNLNDGSIDEAWNSDYIRSARSTMLEGRTVRSCKKCYEEEANGYRSHRVIENQNWRKRIGDEKLLDILEKVDTGGRTSAGLVSIDLRLGNTCNLQCVMCAPRESSKWKSASAGLIGGLTERRLIDEWTYKANIDNERFEWYKDPKFWDQLREHLPSIREIIIGGGEPMLIAKHLEFIKECALSGHAEHIHLRYHTNMTVMPGEMVPYWEKFQTVEFFSSIDGYAEVGDYVRYPAKWSQVLENIRLIDSLKGNIWLRLLYTVHALNVHHLPDFLRWVKAQSFKKERGMGDMQDFVHPGIVHGPNYLNIKTLPPRYKRKVTEAWNELGREFADEGFDKYEAIMSFMNSKDESHRMPLLKDYICALDRSRGTSIREIAPALADELRVHRFSHEAVL